MSGLRTLIVQPFGEVGGAEAWLLKLLDAADGLEPEIVLLKGGPLVAEFERRGIPVEVHEVGRSPLVVAPAVAWMARRIRRTRPEVAMGNVLKAQLIVAPAGKLTRTPTVWAKHDHGYDRQLAVPLARMSTRVIGAIEELAAPTKRADAVIIPPPRPEVEPAPRNEARAHLASLGIPMDDRPALVMAGRLVAFKGVDDAIRALAMPQAADWRLVVAGIDGWAGAGETDRLRGIAAAEGVAERVHFAGQVDRVSHWLAGFDALAVLTKPTGEWRAPGSEGFGTSAFEASLAGIPVVAVASGAVARRLDGGRAGVAVPPNDPRAVADALGKLSDADLRARMGEHARSVVEDHPDVHECARRLVAVLRDAAATRRS